MRIRNPTDAVARRRRRDEGRALVVAWLLVSLASCGPTGRTSLAFRAADAPIYSNAALTPDRLVGRWAQVAAFAAPDAPACAPASVEIAPERGDLRITGALCLSGRRIPVAGLLRAAGPGRFAFDGAGAGAIPGPWWVLWADVDDRTLVIGTPSGAFGFVLDRSGSLPPDRARAARDLLDFNGYDLARLGITRT